MRGLAIPFLLLAGLSSSAQSQVPGGKPEILEKVDPYTRGDPDDLERAGYVGYAPFEWTEGVRTDDVQETLGAGEVLWVETAHFKIGSTLESYVLHADKREEDALDAELARLRTKLARYQPPRNRLDPWMRLHLYAQRLESLHADFTAQFGFAGEPGRGKKGAAAAAQKPDETAAEAPQKFRVLLLEKTSSLGRYLKRYAEREAETWDRFPLPGGAMFLGVSAEGVRTGGYTLDAGLHCFVADALTRNLVDGYCGSTFTCPVWFEYGLAHVAARKVDERFAPTAVAKGRVIEEDDWKWKERVRGLVVNGAAQSWTEMLAWEKWEDMKAQSHLVAWSRVSWLLKRKPEELRTFLIGIARPPADRDPEDISRIGKEHQEAAAKAAFGKSFEELDVQWKKFAGRG